MAEESETKVLKRKFQRRALIWLHLAVSHFITGGCSAISVALAIGAAHGLGVEVQPLTLNQLGAVFFVSGISGAAAYAMKNPIFNGDVTKKLYSERKPDDDD